MVANSTSIKVMGTTWMTLTFLISFVSFGWQGFAKINQTQSAGVSLIGGFFSGFAPALVTCLFSLQVLKFFAHDDTPKKPLFALLLGLMAVTLGQWKTMPEVNGLNSAFEEAYPDSESTLETLQWAMLPILLLIRSVNGFSTVAWSRRPALTDETESSTCQVIKSGIALLPYAGLAGILGYSVSGGIYKAIEAIPSELAYPFVRYTTNLPDLLNIMVYTAFFTWQYAKPVSLGGKHLIHDIKSAFKCRSDCRGATNAVKRILSKGFLATAILFPPIAQIFQSEAAGEDNNILLAVVFLASLLINRGGMSILYPEQASETEPEQIQDMTSLTYFSNIWRGLKNLLPCSREETPDPVLPQ